MAERTIEETVVVVTEAFEGSTLERWGCLILEAAALRPRRLVVDLKRCPRIDAAAIVVLLQAHRAMVVADGGLILRAPSAGVRRMLGLARVDQVFEVRGEATAVPR